jgi:hypothetical protein
MRRKFSRTIFLKKNLDTIAIYDGIFDSSGMDFDSLEERKSDFSFTQGKKDME